MPTAMVSMVVAQIAPGTIGHGVRLIEDRVPRFGVSRARRAIFRLRRIDVARPPEARNLTSVPARHRTETSCAQEPPMLETLTPTRRQE